MALSKLASPDIHTLSVLLRVNCGNLKELDRSLFILSSQLYTKVEVIIIFHGQFTKDILDEINSAITRWGLRFARLALLDFQLRGDDYVAISSLVRQCSGRYIAFVDAHQKIYPNLYSRLIYELEKSDNYAWAFCDVVLTYRNLDRQVKFCWAPFIKEAYSFIDHARMNFIPIQSVVVDSLRIDELQFCNLNYKIEHDHTFLLRLASQHKPLYVHFIGAEESCITTIVSPEFISIDEVKKRYVDLEANRSRLHWWLRQDLLCNNEYPFLDKKFNQQFLDYEASIIPQAYYYRNLLKELYASLSWRITQPIRNAINRFKGIAISENEIPDSEKEALTKLLLLINSSSWYITAPIRLISKIKLSYK